MVVSQPTLRVSVAKASTGSVLVIHGSENADSVVRPLAQAGYEVVVASDLTDGLAHAMKGAFDVVICDASHPSVLDTLSIIQAYERDLPLILLVGPEEPRGQGVQLYARVSKAASEADLLATVERAVEHARATRERPAIRTDVKEITPFSTSVTAPVISATRLRANNTPTVPPRSSNRLDRALASLRVELQPIFDGTELRVVSYEARVSSSEPDIATQPELIASAGIELLRKRARDLAVQAFADAPRGAKLFLDVFPSDLLDADLYAPDAPLSRIADRVVLQLRGGSSLPIADLGPRLSVLRFLGFRLAVADLDGPSRLSLIADVAPDYLKIDACLTRGVDHLAPRRRVVEGLIAMCRALGATAIADGVETAEERAELVRLGCSLVQGPLHPPDRAATPQPPRAHDHPTTRLTPIRREPILRAVRG